ncbi:hypothetical protein OCK74_22845 [Chitinophagaceae bacterium LB-8]|uniref:Uncharacterized protein n=1 Tax=Paraflavisolibacter caeni TaxID=2982496 RepID=A0A9X3B9Z6_9BACT|nr:hypothetical protein [Paraflavisolibacter caeni]MCU7551976.1 hypothetical protein [Paraflavisolibacter caeni]
MLTLKFQSARDLAFFQMVTGILDTYFDDDQLIVRGFLSEAEAELACNAFNAAIIETDLVYY